MSFAIVSSCIVFIDFIVYIVAVGSYNNYSYICHSYYYDCHYKSNDTGIALYSVLLVLALVEFIIALAVAIYCCKNGCSGCCYGDTQGVRFTIIFRNGSRAACQICITRADVMFMLICITTNISIPTFLPWFPSKKSTEGTAAWDLKGLEENHLIPRVVSIGSLERILLFQQLRSMLR